MSIDSWGETVAVLDVDPSGQAVWNGRKADGAAVRDGAYELVADGLRSWVEVDLNAITITDDIRQPLITGIVPTTSSHWAAEFRSWAPSPVDGIVYLTEKLSNAFGDLKMWRWNGERLEDVIDWPAGHWTIHQMSAQEDVFITWGFTGFDIFAASLPGSNRSIRCRRRIRRSTPPLSRPTAIGSCGSTS